MNHPSMSDFQALPVQQWQADAGGEGASAGDAPAPAGATEGASDAGEGTEPASAGAAASTTGGEGTESGGAAGASEPSPAEGAPKSQEAWYTKRINKLTAEKAELRTQLEAQTRDGATQRSGESDAAFEARVQAETGRRMDAAAAQARAQTFTTEVAKQVTEGEKLFGKAEFERSANALGRLCDTTNPAEHQKYMGFLQTMMDTGEMPKLVHMLGTDLEEAERIMGLPAGRQGVELSRLAAKDLDQGSKTPKPARTAVGGRGSTAEAIKAGDPASDSLSTKDWMERREAEVKARREARV